MSQRLEFFHRAHPVTIGVAIFPSSVFIKTENKCVLLVAICCCGIGLVWSNGLVAQEEFETQSGEILELQVETHCAVNEALYQSCFDIDKAECVTLTAGIFASCDQEASSALFDHTSEESINNFSSCVESKYTDYFVAQGVDLDAACQ